MRITANLLYNLWNEIVNCTVYFQDQTLQESNGWILLYKRFYTYLINRRSRKP
jgi:hypothetical protein